MSEPTPSRVLELSRSEWTSIVSRYANITLGRAFWQVANTLIPLALVLWLMYWATGPMPWLTVALAFVAAGFLVRTFIIIHDCAHASFLPWSTANDTLGFITGVLTFTPFTQWRRDHALHHASSGDLDRRGHGDVPTITKREYLARNK
jgi:omega-6 fatty acid desaturase (delta-12 desaturase)